MSRDANRANGLWGEYIIIVVKIRKAYQKVNCRHTYHMPFSRNQLVITEREMHVD